MTTPLSLTVSRLIPATPSRVFELWTSPEHLVRWWGPPGGTCVDAAVDPVVGGAYRLDNAHPDGTMVTITGTFTRIDAPYLLTYTWRIGDGPTELVTVTMTAADGGTQVTVLHERITGEAAANGHTAGWDACLERLTVHALRAMPGSPRRP
jgi:uncharacterized protein YndB with AHSA1/START domain